MRVRDKGNAGIGVLFAIIAAVVIFTVMINIARESGSAESRKTTNINNELKKLMIRRSKDEAKKGFGVSELFMIIAAVVIVTVVFSA